MSIPGDLCTPKDCLFHIRLQSINYMDLQQCFHLSLLDAAKHFQLGMTSFKKLCRKHGIGRWPGRQIQSLYKNIATLEIALQSPEFNCNREKLEEKLFMLMKKRELLLNDPNLSLVREKIDVSEKEKLSFKAQLDLKLAVCVQLVAESSATHEVPLLYDSHSQISDDPNPRGTTTHLSLVHNDNHHHPDLKVESSIDTHHHLTSNEHDHGHWTDREHLDFVAGLRKFGQDWTRIAKVVPTRTPDQIRMHARACSPPNLSMMPHPELSMNPPMIDHHSQANHEHAVMGELNTDIQTDVSAAFVSEWIVDHTHNKAHVKTGLDSGSPDRVMLTSFV